MNTHMNTNTGTDDLLGDSGVAEKLRFLAERLPGNPLPDGAVRAFALKDVQQLIVNKVLQDPIDPRLHPLWVAFDPEHPLHSIHNSDEFLENCSGCIESIVGTHEELMREAEAELAAEAEQSATGSHAVRAERDGGETNEHRC